MLTRPLRLLMVVLLVAAGVNVVRTDEVTSSVTMSAAKSRSGCKGLDRGDVRGEEPTYSNRGLTEFRNHKRLCHGLWLPEPRRHLVPQGLAITGRSAWLSGFRYRKGYGKRPCQLARVDLVTGRRLAFHSAIFGQVGERPRTYCRHGGGIAAQGKLLWMVERGKLWLVDPMQGGDVLNARRVWRIHAPVRGSAIVANSKRLGIVPFQERGVARIYWFSLKRLLRPGVLDLATRHAGTRQLGPVASTRVPRFVQGATLDSSGRLYLSRSNLVCGELTTPYGKRVALIPGAEGIQFASGGKRLWAVSESSARPYLRARKPFTPAVVSYEWPRLFRSKASDCGFPAY